MNNFITGPNEHRTDGHLPVNLEYVEYLGNGEWGGDDPQFDIYFYMTSKKQITWTFDDFEIYKKTWNNIIKFVDPISINKQVTL